MTLNIPSLGIEYPVLFSTSTELLKVAEEWFEHKKSLTEKSEDNPKLLSPKTVQGYNSPLTDILIPYFNTKPICLITEQNIKDLINSISGYRTKEIVYVVLKMLFDFAREKIIFFIYQELGNHKKLMPKKNL